MRLLKIMVLLLALGSVPLAGQELGVTAKKAGIAEVRALKGTEPIQRPEGNFVDPLGNLGELPSAFEVDPNILEDARDLDAKAKELAGLVLKGSESALPPLIAALQLSGLQIRHDSRELFSPAGKSQGLIVQAWEVQAMGRLARFGFNVALPDAAEWIAGVAKFKDPDLLGKVLLESIRLRAAAETGSIRFWGRFIVELGRQSQFHPVDLLSQGTLPQSVHLDAVQMALVLGRFGGDLWAAAEEKKKTGRNITAPRNSVGSSLTSSFFPASAYWSYTAQPLPAAPLPGGDPCAMNQIDGYKGDALALFITSMRGNTFGKLWGMLTSSGRPNIEPIGGGELANLGLAYAKLALAYCMFDVEYSTRNPLPLERTLSTNPGKENQIRMRALMREANPDFVNCLRPLLNVLEIDFNVEKTGPIGGSPVIWRMHSGGDMIRFKDSDIVHGRTDEQGNASVLIEGVPRKKTLPETTPKVKRRAVVSTQVAIKPPSIKQNFVDALGALTGGITGLATIPAEILYRTGLGFEKPFPFDVIDRTENLKFTLDGTISESETCAGDTVWINGRFKAEIVLKPNCEENEPGCTDFYGSGEMKVVEPWTYNHSRARCTINPEDQPLDVHYFGDSGKIAISIGADTDKWKCTPGSQGESWWWHQFLLSQSFDIKRAPNGVWFEWRSEESPPEGIVARRVISESRRPASCDWISQDLRLEIRIPD